MSSSQIKVRLEYTDNSERVYSMQITDQMAVDQDFRAYAKQKIRDFNTAAASIGSSVQQTFVSTGGNNVTRIVTAEIVTTQEEVIYNG